jgi:hypothetical protein
MSRPHTTAVIPAQAGIAGFHDGRMEAMDSRLRGNDEPGERSQRGQP